MPTTCCTIFEPAKKKDMLCKPTSYMCLKFEAESQAIILNNITSTISRWRNAQFITVKSKSVLFSPARPAVICTSIYLQHSMPEIN